MVGYDCETTGTDPETARIVTATVVEIIGGEATDHTWLINPGIPIPDEAAAIHGITTETAQAQGLDPAYAIPEIRERLHRTASAGHPLVIMNAPYDLTVLDRELRRLGQEPLNDNYRVIDPMVIDRHLDKWRRGKRTLADLCLHYQVGLNGAHTAAEDAIAAARLAWRLARVWPQMGELSLDELHDLQRGWRLTWADDFRDYLTKQGKPADDVSGEWPMREWRGDADHGGTAVTS